MENYKFNIGDIITIIHGGYESNDPFTFNGVTSFSQTSNRTIKEIQFINGKNWYKVSNHGNWVTEEGLKLITPIKEQPSLSVNDLVKYEYYYTKDKNSDFWMLYRFKQINSNDEAFYTCCITKYKEFTKEDWLNISSRRITRKATPEEIQWLDICFKEGKFIEFDKVKNYMNKETKFEKGKWYKRDTGSYVKFSHLSDDVFNASESILTTSFKYSNCPGSYGSIENSSNTYTLIDNSEIQEYLPEGHVDKFPKELSLLEQAKLKYPIGTRFICPFFKNECLKGKGNLVDHHNLTVSESGDITGSGMYYLRYKNQWAEIVQESPKLPIVGKVYDSSFQYVECICSYTGKEVGKIYEVYDSPDWFKTKQTIKKFMSFGNWTAWFKPSTYSEYLKQQNPITPKECINNDIIEVGDEVELVKHLGFKADSNHKYSKENLIIGNRYKVLSAPYNYSDTTTEKGIKVENGQDYCYPVECFKITKKANTQTTTINKKSDISSAIQVGNDVTVLDVFKSKQSKLMDYYAFIQQSPKELSKIKKNKFLTLTNN